MNSWKFLFVVTVVMASAQQALPAPMANYETRDQVLSQSSNQAGSRRSSASNRATNSGTTENLRHERADDWVHSESEYQAVLDSLRAEAEGTGGYDHDSRQSAAHEVRNSVRWWQEVLDQLRAQRLADNARESTQEFRRGDYVPDDVPMEEIIEMIEGSSSPTPDRTGEISIYESISEDTRANEATYTNSGTVADGQQEMMPKHLDDTTQLDDCPICLEQIDKLDRVLGLVCGHKFHQACIKRWKHAHPFKGRCPVCRADTLNSSF